MQNSYRTIEYRIRPKYFTMFIIWTLLFVVVLVGREGAPIWPLVVSYLGISLFTVFAAYYLKRIVITDRGIRAYRIYFYPWENIEYVKIRTMGLVLKSKKRLLSTVVSIDIPNKEEFIKDLKGHLEQNGIIEK